MVGVGDRVFFAADDGEHGRELWTSDGTSDGTTLVKDIWPGSGDGLVFDSGGGNPNLITPLGNRVFFTARDGKNGLGVYVSDGTSAGTTRLMRRRDCDPGSRQMVVDGSLLVFAAADANGVCNLYVTDGTVPGTVLVSTGIPAFRMPVYYRNHVFFVAGDNPLNVQLWKTAAIPGGVTKMVRTFRYEIQEMAVSGGRLFLSSWALWRSDGTRAGTKRLDAPVYPYYMTNLNGTLLFASSSSSQYGRGLWRSNGRNAGTAILADFGRDPYAGIPSLPIWAGKHRAYFISAEDRASLGLWTSDGTPGGTHFVAKLILFGAATTGDRLYGVGCYRDETTVPYGCDYGWLLFTSDGTPEGTHEIQGAAGAYEIAIAGNTVFLNVNGDLWAYAP